MNMGDSKVEKGRKGRRQKPGDLESLKKEKPFYTVQELAVMFGCSQQNIYHNYIYKGRLPAKKLGGRLIVLKEDLINYLKSLPYVVDLEV